MENSYYFEKINEKLETFDSLIAVREILQTIAKVRKLQIYLIDKPINEKNYQYSYSDGIVILIPGVRVLFLNLGEDSESFDNFVDDFIDDLDSISVKYDCREFLGRPRKWKSELVYSESLKLINEEYFNQLICENTIDGMYERKGELLISLLTGSINDINRIDGEYPDNILEKIKKNIMLFDGEQSRFIYKPLNKKMVTIQGLAGTGKTELLLHKLKELYVSNEDTKIFFSCSAKYFLRN